MDIWIFVEQERCKEEGQEDGEEGIGVDVELDLHGGGGVGYLQGGLRLRLRVWGSVGGGGTAFYRQEVSKLFLIGIRETLPDDSSTYIIIM